MLHDFASHAAVPLKCNLAQPKSRRTIWYIHHPFIPLQQKKQSLESFIFYMLVALIENHVEFPDFIASSRCIPGPFFETHPIFITLVPFIFVKACWDPSRSSARPKSSRSLGARERCWWWCWWLPIEVYMVLLLVVPLYSTICLCVTIPFGWCEGDGRKRGAIYWCVESQIEATGLGRRMTA